MLGQRYPKTTSKHKKERHLLKADVFLFWFRRPLAAFAVILSPNGAKDLFTAGKCAEGSFTNAQDDKIGACCAIGQAHVFIFGHPGYGGQGPGASGRAAWRRRVMAAQAPEA